MEIFINPLSTPKKMTEEDELIPFSRDLETIAEMTWQQFVDRANELRNKLHRMYDESAVERQEYYRDVCVGGYNFGKTVGWVVNYSPHLKALEGVASALEAIAQWPNAGSMAWEMRKFIKFSSVHGYNNVESTMPAFPINPPEKNNLRELERKVKDLKYRLGRAAWFR